MEPYDEESISGDDTIIRRVNPRQHVVPDHNSGGQRVSSKLFSPSSGPNGGMSVDLLGLIKQSGVEPKQFVTTPEFTGSVAFAASSARDCGLWIGFNPTEHNPYHGEVWRPPPPCGNFSKGQKRTLMSSSSWFVELAGVTIPER